MGEVLPESELGLELCFWEAVDRGREAISGVRVSLKDAVVVAAGEIPAGCLAVFGEGLNELVESRDGIDVAAFALVGACDEEERIVCQFVVWMVGKKGVGAGAGGAPPFGLAECEDPSVVGLSADRV